MSALKRNGFGLILILVAVFFLIVKECAIGDESVHKDRLTLDIIKDTSISSVGSESIGNNGKSRKLKLKSIQEYILFDIDATRLKGVSIKKAWLHFRSASPVKAPVKMMGISTLASDWVEGGRKGFKPEKGSSCYIQAAYGKQDWSYDGSTLMDVVFGRGHTIWQSREVTIPDQNGWQKCEIDPDIVAARVAGISKGFCLYDDVGSEWFIKNGKFIYNFFPNRKIYSRESLKSAPWIQIEKGEQDYSPPHPINFIKVITDELPSGEAFLFWKTPLEKTDSKILGFDVFWEKNKIIKKFPRYLVPMAGKPGEQVKMHIQDMNFGPGENINVSIHSIDGSGNRSKPHIKKILLSKGFKKVEMIQTSIQPFKGNDTSIPTEGIDVSVIDLLDKIIPEKDAMIPAHDKEYKRYNHIFSRKDKIIRIHGARNEDICFQLDFKGEGRNLSMDCVFENEPYIKPIFYKFEYVRDNNVFIPDPLIPVDLLNIEDIKINNTFLCEIYIPHNISAGTKKGKLFIRAGKKSLEINIDLTVWNFVLPDRLSFVPEMNAYSTVSPYSNNGYAFYRLAHRHRTCINRLPYGWDGKPEFAPIKLQKGFKWSKWDANVGPLVDGSAFSDLPRKNQPIDVFYLPLSENWPVELKGKYKKSWWAQNALSESYRSELKSRLKDMILHIRDKGWDKTQFQFYLNNKVHYKRQYEESSAPWIFDEPVNIQDFMALKWYGELWQESLNQLKVAIKPVFRCDISYNQYGRNILWDVCDIEYIGGNDSQKTRMKHDEFIMNKKKQFAEYGNANQISDSNVQPVLWQISAWSNGASGVLPWQTIGSEKCWERGEQTALFYPKGDEVYPSVRLKAFRYGQQFIEYLEKIGEVLELPDAAVREWIRNRLQLKSIILKESENDAGTIVFGDISIFDLWRLRYEIGETITHRLSQQCM